MNYKQAIKKIKRADVVMVIPSKNNADTIELPTKAMLIGALKYFPDKKVAVINLDSSSVDGTKKAFTKAAGDIDHKHHLVQKKKIYLSTTNTDNGKGAALLDGLRIAHAVRAKAFLTVDSDLRSITPEWVDRLLSPVLHRGYDFISPYYLRHKYTATITNTIIYPMVRMLYRKNVRQPIGGEFAMSAKMVDKLLSLEWSPRKKLFGVDIFFTTTALANYKKVGQAFLGVKNHNPKDPGLHLGPMFNEVIGTLFMQMNAHKRLWIKNMAKKVQEISLFGLPFKAVVQPGSINRSDLVKRFKLGFKKYKKFYQKTLTEETFVRLSTAAALSERRFNFDIELWFRTIAEFSVYFNDNFDDREKLMASFVPLYFGRTVTFTNDTIEMDQEEAEEYIKGSAREFDKFRPYLIGLWTGKKMPKLNGKNK